MVTTGNQDRYQFLKLAGAGLAAIALAYSLTACGQIDSAKMTLETTASDPLKLDFEYVGQAVQKERTHVWGTSPVIGKDGRVHLYLTGYSGRKEFNLLKKKCLEMMML